MTFDGNSIDSIAVYANAVFPIVSILSWRSIELKFEHSLNAAFLMVVILPRNVTACNFLHFSNKLLSTTVTCLGNSKVIKPDNENAYDSINVALSGNSIEFKLEHS